MSTKALRDALINKDKSIWADMRGRPLTDRGLANILKDYEISSGTVRVGEWTGKGYAKKDFHDAWHRYLPSQLPQGSQGYNNR